MRKYREKIEILKKVVQHSAPLDIDYKAHNGEYKIELSMIQSITIDGKELRPVTLQGVMRNEKILMQMIVWGDTLFTITDLPMVMRMGDRTAIYRIIQDSILFANAALGVPDLYRVLQQIEDTTYPFSTAGEESLSEKEAAFMQQIAVGYTNKVEYHIGKTQHVTTGTARFREAVCWDDENTRRKASIKTTLKKLAAHVPEKGQLDKCPPDVYTHEYDMEDKDEVLSRQVLLLNTRPHSTKGKFWWDYFKLNVYLSDPEYNQGFYLLLNGWKMNEIRKWLVEYRKLGYYESAAGQSGIAFIVKSTAKSPFRILNVWGQVLKIPVRRSKKW